MSKATDWQSSETVPSRRWTCGYCGAATGNDRGYKNTKRADWHLVICPVCFKPTFFEGATQMPGAAYGAEVQHLPPLVEGLYSEARNCMIVNAFTASALACRKLLMNVAVSQGAPENAKFFVYVNYLADKGFVPPNAKGWVDHIRDKGNEATHEIPPIKADDARDLLTFIEMILKLVFEFPNRVPKPTSPPKGSK